MAEHSAISAEMIAVHDDKQCVGFIVRHGDPEGGTEAYDINEQSIGLFEDDAAAASAVWRRAHKQKPRERPQPPIFVLRLRPENGVDPIHALRNVLKELLRRHGMRCVSAVEQEQPPEEDRQ